MNSEPITTPDRRFIANLAGILAGTALAMGADPGRDATVLPRED